MTPNSAELVRADHEAMLIVGSFVAAQQDPAIWERFCNRLFDDWQRNAAAAAASRADAANQAIAALGRLSATREPLPGVDAAKADKHAEPTPDTISGSTTGV